MLTRITVSRGASAAAKRTTRCRNFTSAAEESPASTDSKIVEDASLENVAYDVVKQLSPGAYRRNGNWNVRLKRFSMLSSTGDVVRFLEREGKVKPTKVSRVFDPSKTRVTGWRADYKSKEEAQSVASNISGKDFGLFRQPKEAAVSDFGMIDVEADETWVEVLNVPAGSRRIDVSSFLSVGSFIHPRDVFERPGETRGTKRWLARFRTAEERTISMVKRSGQHMHPYGRTDVVSEDKIRVVPVATAWKASEN